MTKSLQDLPNEVLYQIFLFVPPSSVPLLQRVCRRFNDISQPLLWRFYCRTLFKFWSPNRHMQAKFSGNVNHTDWKAIFLERHNIDHLVSKEIDNILSSQSGRIAKAENILASGYDVKDALLRNLNVGDDAEDVLARRYYSDSVIGSLHRSIAIDQWVKLLEGDEVPLEKALGAFDLFVLHGRDGDLEDTSRALDDIVDNYHALNPFHSEKTTRDKCIDIADYLKNRDLVGLKGNVNANYHNMQNNFIGIALQDPDHPSLPLISVAIFCCIAQRLGLNAHPCGFPFHVLAVVKPSNEQANNGLEPQHQGNSRPIYMDPFRLISDIDVADLKSQLLSLGIAAEEHEKYLDASPIAEIIRRCAKNIITSVQSLPRHEGAHQLSSVECFPEMDGAFYSSLWALTLLTDKESPNADSQRASFLPYIVQRVESIFPYDFSLVEKHILPRFRDIGRRDEMLASIQGIRADNEMPKHPKERTQTVNECVCFRVGQYFQHRRYHYHAVITGWDVECMAGDAWISRMRVNELSRGKHQSFYHVQVEDGSTRYVAEDNIELVDTTPSPKLMTLAGQYFKRWDEHKKAFISNIRDEYPDD